ncbi:hypothetical protein DL95DRAFT_467721 [Leptodontidium sp. 2 PMI_412]|nr:hypothetical protein DL95DRAFT_467721 [Leptodontidium sp. 2 PMI_412]
MIWIYVALLALVSATTIFEKEARQVEEPGIDQIFISNFTAGGNGCPQGAAGSTLSGDRKSCLIYVSFDNYQAYTGPVFDHRDYFHGYAVLHSGITGVMQAVYYFGSRLENTTTEARISGPIWDVFTVKKGVPESGRIWSPCGTSVPLLARTKISLVSDEVVIGTYVFPGILGGESSVSHTWVTSVSFRKC